MLSGFFAWRHVGRLKVAFCLFLWLSCRLPLYAGQPSPEVIKRGERDFQRRMEEERRRRRELEEAVPEARLPAPELPAARREYPKDESPSFLIREIRLEGDGAEKFQWALRAAADAVGRSLGPMGLNILMARVQERIASRGYVAARVVARRQDLRTGVFTLILIPGRIASIRLGEGSGRFINLRSIVPVRKGRISAEDCSRRARRHRPRPEGTDTEREGFGAGPGKPSAPSLGSGRHRPATGRKGGRERAGG